MSECDKCGKCCADIENHSHACRLDWRDLLHRDIRKQAIQLDDMKALPYLNGRCPFLSGLKGNLCSIQDHKPHACRIYQCEKMREVKKDPPNYRDGSTLFDETCYKCPEFSQTKEQWLQKMGYCATYKREVGEYKRCDDWVDKYKPKIIKR